jgi:KDO2-lipid IV(A) lauroyltransferase
VATKLSHRLEYAAAAAIVRLARSMSADRADRFGARLGRIVHSVWGKRRRITLDNLTRALGNEYSAEELDRICRRVFENLGRTLIEFARFRVLRAEGVLDVVDEYSTDMLDDLVKQGKGAVLLSAHYGNWELLGAWVAARGYKCSFVVSTQHNLLFDQMLTRFRSEMGVRIIHAEVAMKTAFKRLRKGEFICMVADQHVASASIVVDFFGRPAATARGPALLAIRAGSPIIPALMRREQYDRHIIMAGEPLYAPGSGDDDADVRWLTEKYTRYLQDGIARCPDQWMWTHRRWKVDNAATSQ